MREIFIHKVLATLHVSNTVVPSGSVKVLFVIVLIVPKEIRTTLSIPQSIPT